VHSTENPVTVQDVMLEIFQMGVFSTFKVSRQLVCCWQQCCFFCH